MFKREIFYITRGFILAFYIFITPAYSQTHHITGEVAYEEAFHFVEYLNLEKNESLHIISTQPLALGNSNNPAGYVFSLAPHGFIVISPYPVSQPVMAFSYDNDFASKNDDSYQIALDILLRIAKEDKILQGVNNNTNSTTLITPTEEIGPLVKSLFGQVNCHDADGNIVNVSNIYTPNHYAPGCVAISLSTMLHYYQWPVHGTGTHTDHDTRGLSRGSYTADFENTYYDWENILYRYNYRNTTLQQRQALGLLEYHTAIALDTDFEYNGSTANVKNIPNTGENFFRFTARYGSARSPAFWKAIDTALAYGIPSVFAVSSPNGAKHSVVCDGMRLENGVSTFHHLNMGWWGTSNGWYRVKTNFNAGGYTKVDGGTINFLPVPEIDSVTVSADSTFITVHWLYTQTLEPEAFEIQARYDEQAWISLGDTLITDSIKISWDNFEKKAEFRVRAKMLGKYADNGWSNTFVFNKKSSATTNIGTEEQVKVFPNPFSRYIAIESEKNILNVAFYDMKTNALIINKKINSKRTAIDTPALPGGLYLIKIVTKDETAVKKVIKF